MNSPQKLGRYMVATASPVNDRWLVADRKGERLGEIEWHASWGHYEFCPRPLTAYSHDCLAAMSEFLVTLNAERRTK